ncbi:MAG TPA: four-carbon acid sugar kinase family protein [Ornithinimicrobium sp.]|uniref:four-carbon acid sugar kinase family protein n=1 Tax=Ornithinimicrobium sp. TaxID=1977084 RepID=UPI002B49F2F3|nr:four-carbon acid sugar kinase family protein [Ornithinimicrobium sp.]HKJ10998.1 four-carbon acid sugar kinase family protein [Ornithinimicrobium sp.]
MDGATPVAASELLSGYPDPLPVSATEVQQAREGRSTVLVVLDDDPTGTQSVAELPVLTRWEPDDLAWAMQTGSPAVYVMTNSRSLSEEHATARNVEVVRAAGEAADALGLTVDFVSRSDSTLRGHYPLEPQVLVRELADAGVVVDAVIIVPAFGDAGRITVGSVHYAGSQDEGYLPVGQTEFARDETFGYTASDLRDWVAEKTDGAVPAGDVAAITLDQVRAGADAVADRLAALSEAAPVVVDIVTEADLRVLALGILAAEARGSRFVHRVGPPFVRALVGQEAHDPLTAPDVDRIRSGGPAQDAAHGLVVVGSHVDLTTRQVGALRRRHALAEVEIDVNEVLGEGREAHLAGVVQQVTGALQTEHVVVQTSRTLVSGDSGADSLDIARAVSAAVVQVVQSVLETAPLRFVVAKGGITSSDVASHGLSIGRAMCRGPMLPGLVSLWEPVDGPAQGIPYLVFAGNVGDEDSLADVVDTLSEADSAA